MAVADGKEPPFAQIAKLQAQYFVRARCKKPKGSSDYEAPADEKVQAFVRNYLSNLHASLLTAL